MAKNKKASNPGPLNPLDDDNPDPMPEDLEGEEEWKNKVEKLLIHLDNRQEEIAKQYNLFVAKMDEQQNMIAAINPRAGAIAGGNGSKEAVQNSNSQSMSENLNKKFSDATLRDLIEAGDLGLRIHERRQGLDDFEKLMVDTGKKGFEQFLGNVASVSARKDVTS